MATIAETTRGYHYHGQRVLLRTTVSGGGTESDGRMFVFGNYLDEVLVMGCRFSTSWFDFYYGHDHLYSPTVLYGSTDIAVERYEYDAYGSVQILTSAFYPLASSQYGNPYTFTGRERDMLDAGSCTLMYYRARYYDPAVGRFMSLDPIGYYGGLNLYAYCKNRPIVLTDPEGLKPWYGNYCGPGSSGAGGRAHDGIDRAGKEHDECYAKCGGPGGAAGVICPSLCRRNCDIDLCNNVMWTDCFQSPTPWKCHAARLIIAEIFCARPIISPL